MSFVTDLRLAARSLARRPAWTATVAGTLAIGLGGAIVVGGIAYGILVRPLPYPESDRLVRLYEVDERGRRMNFADPNFADLEALDGAFEAVAKAPVWPTPSHAGDEPIRPKVASISAGFFDVLGVEPARGRRPSPAEHVDGAAAVVVVSDALWRTTLGAATDLDAIRFEVAGAPARVVGVAPPGFDFPAGAEVWLPIELSGALPSRTAHNNPVYARLARGATLDGARGAVRELGARLARQYTGDIDLVSIEAVPVLDSVVAHARQTVRIELAAAAFLLLAAVVNAGALTLARLETRRRDLATRLALGARGGDLGRLLYAETALTALVGAAAGFGLAGLALAALRRWAPAALPRLDAVRLDTAVVAGAIAAALLTALLVAAAATHRTLGWNVERELREGAGAIAGGRRRWLRGLPVAVQAGAAIVLLAGAALFAASLLRLASIDPGFRAEGVTALDVYPGPMPEEADVVRRVARLDDLERELATLPGVRSAGLVSSLPIASPTANGTFAELAGPELPEPFDYDAIVRSAVATGDALFLVASEGYFPAMAIPLVEGRLFEPADTRERPHVALVSASLAAAVWPGESAVGRWLEFGNMDGDPRPLRVVGVVGDVHQRGLAEGPQPAIYVNARQRPSRWMWTAVVAGGSPRGETLLRAARRHFPDAPAGVRNVEGEVQASVADRRLLLAVVAVFALATVGLTAAGVFGAVSFAVAVRRREFAVRLALGADGDRVARGAFAGGLAPVALGVVAGLGVALAGGRLLESLLYGVRPQHPPSLAAALATVALFAALAAWLPARRAGRIEPASALRAE